MFDKLNSLGHKKKDLEPEKKDESENANKQSLELKRTIATENGKFYNAFLDTLLEVKSPEEEKQKITALIDSLPGPMKKLYADGLSKLGEEFQKNNKLLAGQRGNEVKYLLNSVMVSDGKSQEEIEEIFENIKSAQFVEPSPGVAIIQVEKDFFRKLQDHGVVSPVAHAGAFLSDNINEPSFLVTQRMSLEKNFNEDISLAKKNNRMRHETHHLIWRFLERRGDYVRKPAETDPELSKAFKYFRDELTAYTIEKRDVDDEETENLVYTENKEILKPATEAKDFFAACVKVAKEKGVSPQDFIFASMSSRDFGELENNALDLVPLENIGKEDVAALYLAWNDGYRKVPKIAEILERKKLTIPSNLIEDCAFDRLSSPKITSLSNVFKELKNVTEFTNLVKASPIDEKRLISKLLEERSSLPKETIEVVLALPHDQIESISLDKTNEDLLLSFISLWRIEEETNRATYKQIINSSPILRDAFEKVRSEIVSQGAAAYHFESQTEDEEKTKQIESKIQKKSQLLLEL